MASTAATSGCGESRRSGGRNTTSESSSSCFSFGSKSRAPASTSWLSAIGPEPGTSLRMAGQAPPVRIAVPMPSK